MTKNNLMALAIEARTKAYSPYSNYQVGAALLCEDGSTFCGCNIENASYGLSMCAERVALYQAIAQGKRQFKAIAITGSGNDLATPCGACRQVMAEFAPEMTVYIDHPAEGRMITTTVEALLPYPFLLTEKNEVKK